MTSYESFAVLAIFAPLLGAGVVPLAGRISSRVRDAAAVAFGGSAALFSVLALLALDAAPVRAYAWIPALGISFDLRIDALGAFVAAIAGTIGFLVVVYSLGYMRHAAEEGYSLSRYHALVLLFIGAMIGLALSDSLLAFYVFWETVGLCSFALISYYHRDPKARRAGFKAFAVTRVGDIGLLVAVVALWSAGIVTFTGLEASGVPSGILTIAAVGTLLAALGKSAQVPLHVWLPDAMEAPTTMSALIHAATMVNAGVYLVVRTFPAFEGLGWWPLSLLWIGAITSFVAALSAYAESDLKRVLAHSTISQLGLMMAGVGAGALLASQFHLLSQAIFKALLFLAAGAVIQAAGTRDMFRMGGQRRSMPRTSAAFLVGVLAMAGIPIFIGFWSKELLLEGILDRAGAGVYLVLVATTFLTVAYSWRAYWLVFRGTSRGPSGAGEAPSSMASVLVILSGAAIVGGALLAPYSAAMEATMPAYPVHAIGLGEALEAALRWPAVLVPLLGVLLTLFLLFAYGPRFERRLSATSAFARLVDSGFLFDAAYRGTARGLAALGQGLRRTQTGDLNVNAAGLVGGLVVLLVLLLRAVI